MVKVERSLLIAHSAQRMFDLVEDIEAYPDFLPWCARTEVSHRDADSTVATLYVDYLGARAHFTTRNDKRPPQSMRLKLVDGPFHQLEGLWHFKSLAENACKIEFRLGYEFSGRLFNAVIGPVFGHICDTMVDAFAQRANEVYGEGYV